METHTCGNRIYVDYCRGQAVGGESVYHNVGKSSSGNPHTISSYALSDNSHHHTSHTDGHDRRKATNGLRQDAASDIPNQQWYGTDDIAFQGCLMHWRRDRRKTHGTGGDDLPVSLPTHHSEDRYIRHVQEPRGVVYASLDRENPDDHHATWLTFRAAYSRCSIAIIVGSQDCKSYEPSPLMVASQESSRTYHSQPRPSQRIAHALYPVVHARFSKRPRRLYYSMTERDVSDDFAVELRDSRKRHMREQHVCAGHCHDMWVHNISGLPGFYLAEMVPDTEDMVWGNACGVTCWHMESSKNHSDGQGVV
jgi:hypothetical protein